MKNIKKIICALLALTLSVLMFAGCGSNKKQLIMGTNASFPPYEFTDDSDNIVGIDAEIAQAVADKLDMELVIKDMEFDSLLPAVQKGSIDVVFAGLTVTEERKESVDFTQSYATGVQSIIVKDGSDIASVDDLEGKKIGVQSGTTGDIYCTGDYGEENVNQYANGALAVAALLNDQIDCVIIDNEPAKSYVASNDGLKILDTEYVKEDYAAAVSKDNNDLLNDINKAMDELKADGKIDEILNKYIKAD